MHSVATQRLTHELMENAHRQLEDTEAKLRQEHRQELDELSASHKAEIGVSQLHIAYERPACTFLIHVTDFAQQ